MPQPGPTISPRRERGLVVLVAGVLLASCTGASRAPRVATPATTQSTAMPAPAMPASAMPDTVHHAVMADADALPDYRGAIGPSTPPPPAAPPPRPLDMATKQTLAMRYAQPEPMGPPEIPRPVPAAMRVVGRGPVVQVLPGPTTFADSVPELLRIAMPPKSPFSNNVKRLPKGSLRFVAFDRTLNDTKLSRDSMEFEATFTDPEGHEWRVLETRMAPVSPNPVGEPWLGGVGIDTIYHGTSGLGTAAEPLLNCQMCAWGWADIWRDGKRVASSAPLHVMMTSHVRDARKGYQYACYDCTTRPGGEVHLIVHPSAYLPTPGGFLHLMWENADVQRGTPDAIARLASREAPRWNDIAIDAVPYLKWNRSTVEVDAGTTYRLLITNKDPVSFHEFAVHGMKGMSGMMEHHGAGDGDEHAGKEGDLPHVEVALPLGALWVTTIRFDEPGEYPFMCHVMNHGMRGMVGKFVVRPAPAAARGVRQTGGTN